ncbi:LLM class flavin-dependent oxidoreductase, partial [Nocardioides sp.]
MPDYGHALRFGTFITPVHTPVMHAVEKAELAEGLGFDLVTFQDHPYQPSFHDTWTLLTWVAASTSRIQVSGNVLNLPLRPPAILARSAASLDLLSGGRFALGLGAGAFWDAIEAMGGRRLTPGQSVDALSEAVDVIRGIWDPDVRGPLRAGGEWYRVNGAKPGPAPAHEIPIWLGALKPRMQRLVGEKADGWLPSFQYIGSEGLTAGNRVIDEAAESAGRDPREVTRLLNISPGMPAEELTRMAVEEGVSVFILATDDPGQLEEFASDVIPAVRKDVEGGRAAHGTRPAARVRGQKALSLRQPGIDYDGLPASLIEAAVEPGDAAYRRYRSAYMRGGAPGLVLRPRTVEQVRDAVEFSGEHRELPLGILSAGHGVSGRSVNQGGLVIDVSALNHIEVLDAEAGRVRIGPGARWVDVALALAPHGLAISSGDYGGVGVGGLATAGGVGWFARQHGLTIDHLRSVDVVLADGALAHASEEENRDLFWAMRGAGANFGIAVSFDFQAARVAQLGFAQLTFDATDTAGFIERWGTYIENADRAVSGEAILASARGGGRTARVLLAVDSDIPDQIVEHLQPITQVAPLLDQQIAIGRYDEVIGMFVTDQPQQGQGEPVSRSGLIGHLSRDFAHATAAFLDSGVSPWFQIRTVGGAVADTPADATAYGWRDANFSIVALGS